MDKVTKVLSESVARSESSLIAFKSRGVAVRFSTKVGEFSLIGTAKLYDVESLVPDLETQNVCCDIDSRALLSIGYTPKARWLSDLFNQVSMARDE